MMDSGYVAECERGMVELRNRMKGHRKSGFTLIELLVVIVILGILFGILSPAILHMKAVAKRKRRDAELVTLGSAVRLYRHEYDMWPGDTNEYAGTNTLAFSNDNYVVLSFLRTKAQGGIEGDYTRNSKDIQFLNIGDYNFSSVSNTLRVGGTDYSYCNVIDPYGSNYIFVIDLTNDCVTVE